VTKLQAAVIEEARRHLKVREIRPNWSPEITQWLKACGILQPAPYCAAFVSWCMKRGFLATGEKDNFRDTAGALRLAELNPGRVLSQIDAAVALATPEPVIGVIDHGKGRGHAFFALSVDGDTLTTLEANTSPGPSAPDSDRDGDGVHLRTDRQFYDVDIWIRI
jgi:hypothetical protein